jgi:putative NADPH-quinone reductase
MGKLKKTATMKILAINASHRGERGHTHFLINKLFQGAAAAGAECETVTLARLKINRCLACGRCHTDGHPLQCVYDDKDDVRAVFHKMAGADILIYATPVYVFGMTGLLKTFIDRMNATGDTFDLRMSEKGLMFHHIDRAICSKPFVVLVCCDNLETETPRNVLSSLRLSPDLWMHPGWRACQKWWASVRTRGDPDRQQRFLRYLRYMLRMSKQVGNWPEKGGFDMGRNVVPIRRSSRSRSLVS